MTVHRLFYAFVCLVFLSGCGGSPSPEKRAEMAMKEVCAAEDDLASFQAALKKADLMISVAPDGPSKTSLQNAYLLFLGAEGIWKLQSHGCEKLIVKNGDASAEVPDGKSPETKREIADLVALSKIVIKQHGLADMTGDGEILLGNVRKELFSRAQKAMDGKP